MLVVQMIGCHNVAMATLRRARRTDRGDFLATYGNLAARRTAPKLRRGQLLPFGS